MSLGDKGRWWDFYTRLLVLAAGGKQESERKKRSKARDYFCCFSCSSRYFAICASFSDAIRNALVEC